MRLVMRQVGMMFVDDVKATELHMVDQKCIEFGAYNEKLFVAFRITDMLIVVAPEHRSRMIATLLERFAGCVLDDTTIAFFGIVGPGEKSFFHPWLTSAEEEFILRQIPATLRPQDDWTFGIGTEQTSMEWLERYQERYDYDEYELTWEEENQGWLESFEGCEE